MRHVLFLFTLCLSLTVSASVIHNLEGTLGKSEICMRFEDFTMDYPDDEPTIVNAQYFYKKELKDIPIRGRRDGNRFVFYFDEDNGKFKEKFTLNLVNGNQFTGFWESAKGKKIEVQLRPISVDKINHPYIHQELIQELKTSNPFDYLRSSLFQFKNDSITTYNGKHFQWVSEVHGNIFGFYLGEDFNESSRKNVNPVLEKMILTNALSQLTCTSNWEYNTGNGIEYWLDFTYLDENLLGFLEHASWYCGGAHPDFGASGYLLDLNTGKDYSIDEIVAFDPAVVVYDEKIDNFSEFSAYRDAYFAPGVVELITKAGWYTPSDEDGEDNGDEYGCDYGNPEYWDFSSWIYYEKGIVFIPFFPRVARSCETEEFLIPFSMLKPLKNRKFPYEFPTGE